MSGLPKKVGWIGLGIMGLPMVRNLLGKMKSETQFYIYDVVQKSIDDFVEEGQGRVHACGSSKEVADLSVCCPSTNNVSQLHNTNHSAGCFQDIILSMVPEGSHVKSVYLTENTGVLASSLQSKILLDCSTIDVGTSLAVRDAVAANHPNATFYDSPVSGGALGAAKGTLTFMLGAPNDDPNITLLTRLLELMGSNIFPCGGPSFGLTAKLCNNYCSGLIAIAVSEAMNIGMASGMDPRVLANVFHTSTAQSAICDDWCPVPGLSPEAPASKGYQGGFRVQLMKKDFSLAVESAKRVGVELALGEQGLKVYEETSEDPACRDLDSRVVFRHLGGKEDWREQFPEEVEMKREETRRLLRRGKELEEEEEEKK
jgi:3-hydroxyisobutyrate dehydrogenase